MLPWVLAYFMVALPRVRGIRRRLATLRAVGVPLAGVEDVSGISEVGEREKELCATAILDSAGSTTVGPFRDEVVAERFADRFVMSFVQGVRVLGHGQARVFRGTAYRQLRDANSDKKVLGQPLSATTFVFAFPNSTSIAYSFAFERSGSSVVVRSCRCSYWSGWKTPSVWREIAAPTLFTLIPMAGQMMWLAAWWEHLVKPLVERRATRRYEEVAGSRSGIVPDYANAAGFEGHTEVHGAVYKLRERILGEWNVDLAE
jgi:hypothetical protein